MAYQHPAAVTIQVRRSLPENYRMAGKFSIRDQGLMLKLNVLGFLLLVLFGWLYTAAAVWMRPTEADTFLTLRWTGFEGVWTIVFVLALMFVTIVVHEAIHGLGFYLLASARPVFAFRGVYAYAAAPGWYIPRNRFLLIGMAPLIVISLLGLILMLVVPASWIAPLVLICVVNASGAVGDIWVTLILLRQPPGSYAHDMGETIEIYAPPASQ